MADGDCNQVSQQQHQNEPEEGEPETNLEDELKAKTRRRRLILLDDESEDTEEETATKLVENESEKSSSRIDKKGQYSENPYLKDVDPDNPYLKDFDPNDSEFLKLVEHGKIQSLFPGAILDYRGSHFPEDIENVPVLGFTCVYGQIESESDSGSEVDLEKPDKLLRLGD